MKETTKTLLRDKFLSCLQKDHQNLSENQQWKIANDFSEIASSTILHYNQQMSDKYNSNALELEQHKKQFRDHIEFIDSRAKMLIANFRQNGFMKVENDKRTNKPKLVGRTTMVDDMVSFLNLLNDSVVEFYEKVYKIEGNHSQEFDVKQTTLF